MIGTKNYLTFELDVFVIIRFEGCDDISSIAFGREVPLSDALESFESGCGNLRSHIKKLQGTSDALAIVELNTIQDKFAVIADDSEEEYFCCKLPNTVDRD
jgi:hypothetical protein